MSTDFIPQKHHFKEEIWATLDKEDRLECLKYMERELAAREGRPEKTVVAEPMPKNRRGCFKKAQPDKIFINELYLENPPTKDIGDPDFGPFHAILTVYHESEHAYQYARTCGELRGGNDGHRVKKWRITFSVNKDDVCKDELKTVVYDFSPTEEDARFAALKHLEELKSDFPDEKDLELTINAEKATEQMKVLNATALLGPDFREKVWEMIREAFDAMFEEDDTPKPPTPPKESPAPRAKKRRFSIPQMCMLVGTVIAIAVLYLLIRPSGFLGTLLWIISVTFPFVPLIALSILKKGLPKFFRSKLGGCIFAALYLILFILAQVIYNILGIVYIVGGIICVVKFITEVGPGTLTITKEEADGTTSTEIRLINDESDVKRAENELRDQGYTIKK